MPDGGAPARSRRQITEGGSTSDGFVNMFWDVPSFVVRLSWGSSEGAAPDLDLSALLFNADGYHVDSCHWKSLVAGAGSVQHRGDWMPKTDENADPADNIAGMEEVVVTLGTVPPNVSCIVFVATRYDGAPLGEADGAEVLIMTDAREKEAKHFEELEIEIDDDAEDPLGPPFEQGRRVLGRFALTAKHVPPPPCPGCTDAAGLGSDHRVRDADRVWVGAVAVPLAVLGDSGHPRCGAGGGDAAVARHRPSPDGHHRDVVRLSAPGCQR